MASVNKSIKFTLLGDDDPLKAKLDAMKAGADKLGDRLKGFEITAHDDDARYKLKALELQADRLRDKLGSASLTIRGAESAELKLLKLNALASKLNETITVKVDEKRDRFSLKSLFSSSTTKAGLQKLLGLGSSDAESGASEGASGLLDFAGSPVGLGAIGTGLAMLPAVAGGALGLGIGGGGIAAAFETDKKDAASLSKTFSSAFASIGKGFAPVLHQIAGFAKQISPLLVSMFKSAEPGILAFTKALEPAIETILPELTRVLRQNAPAMKILGEAFGDLLKDGIKLFTGLATGFEASAHIVKGFVDGVGGFLDFLTQLLGNVVRFVGDVFEGHWSDAFHVAENIAKSFVNFAYNTFGKLESFLVNVGIHAMEGLLRGLESEGSHVLSWISGFVSSIPGKFIHLLGIGSPSKVFHDIGINIGQGLANGLEASSGLVNASTDRLARGIPARFSGSYVGAAAQRAALAGSGGQMQLVVSGQGGDLVKQIVKALRYEIHNNAGGNVQKYLGR